MLADLAKQGLEITQDLSQTTAFRMPQEYSPERTGSVDTVTLAQPREAGHGEYASQVSQLTTQGIGKVRGLLADLEFRDRDLQ